MATVSSSLTTATFPGAPDGMNLALPAQDLPDTQARYIQDALVDFPGLTRRRGPVQEMPSMAQPTRPVSGIVTTLDPSGTARYGLINGNGSNGYLSVYSNDLSTLTDLAWPFAMPSSPGTGSPYRLVDAKPSSAGGVLIGIASSYDVASGQVEGLAWWFGGNHANYTTGTISATRGSKTVTGSGTAWLGNVNPGTWLFATTDDGYTSTLIGLVESVNTDTSITLKDPSPYPMTAKAYTLQALRGIYPRVVTGTITVAAAATTVNGGLTKFQQQGLGTGSWNLYRQSDWAWVGKVSSVTNDTSLTLAAGAAIAMADDPYYAIRADGDWSINNGTTAKPGFITAQYAQRQWYFNNSSSHVRTYEAAYADTVDPEAVDLSASGNWFPVQSTSLVPVEAGRGAMAAYNALLLFKENETWAVTGTSPSTFDLSKLADDGALSGMSAQPYNGGVIWAGREGIHYYDGVQVTNLTEERLGNVWRNSITGFDPSKYRMYSMVDRDHYFLHIEDLQPTVSPQKGVVAEDSRVWVVVINLVSGAVTMMTNLAIRGAITLPQTSEKRVWYVVNDATAGHVCAGDDLFDAEGVDTITCAGQVAGPDFYFESKKFDAGDSLRLKKWKLLAIHYLAQGGDLKVDTVLGLNDFGETLTSDFPASVFTWDTLRATFQTWDTLAATFPTWNSVIQSVLVPKRAKFQKQSQHLAFRIYQSSLSMSRVKLGPFQIGFKILRPGRV